MSYYVIGDSNDSDVSIREIVPIDQRKSHFPWLRPRSSDDLQTDGGILPKINASTRTTDPEIDTGYGLLESVVIATVLSSFIFLALAGNALVIVAVLTDRHLRKTSNYFIVSLAVADALVALFVMTFSAANDVTGSWPFGRALCDVWISSDVMCSTASIMNLCAISLDRYVHIRNPLHYESWVTPNRTLLAIVAVWTLSGLISFLPIQLGWHRARPEVEEDDDVIIGSEDDDVIVVCMFDPNPLYAVVSSVVSFYAPCVVMLLIYVKLYHYARMHVTRIRRDAELVSKISGGNTADASKDVRSRVTEHKAAVTLGVIVGVFLVCWTPFFTANVVGAFCGTCIPPGVFSTFTWFGYVNSTMNPVIYGIFNQEFRAAFGRVVARRRGGCCGPGTRGGTTARGELSHSAAASVGDDPRGCGGNGIELTNGRTQHYGATKYIEQHVQQQRPCKDPIALL